MNFVCIVFELVDKMLTLSSMENLIVPCNPMLHTKFRGNRPAGSGEEDFEGFLPYMGMAAILVM